MSTVRRAAGSEPPWYRRRGYPHFDKPLGLRAAIALATKPERVTRHAFLPFIAYVQETPRYKRELKTVESKKRPIAYAAHGDSHILAYYSHVLSGRVEERLVADGISDCVLAYRKFPEGKNNAHFAAEIFAQITSMGDCVVLAMDVEGFFDNMDHKLLKEAWAACLGSPKLPDDHYAVFRAITRYATVSRGDLYKAFDIGRRKSEQFRGPICTPIEFRTRVRGGGLIRAHNDSRGIPQGSPISATLSNMYMLSADVQIKNWCEEHGGVYRRYSDDIILLCKPGTEEDAGTMMERILSDRKLTLSLGKTQITKFAREDSGKLRADKPLQYLGFTFDGARALIRSQTLARYHRNMKQAIVSAARAAHKAGGKGPVRIFRRELFETYSHLGERNLPQYAYKAAEILKSPAINRQVRKHWAVLNARIREAEKARSGDVTTRKGGQA